MRAILCQFMFLCSVLCCAQSDSLARENKMDSLIRRGDFFFANCSEDSANRNYNLAIVLRHDGNAHKQRHIKENQAEMLIPEWCMRERGYNNAIARGDAAFAEKKYQEAKEAYDHARAIRPDDPYPVQQMKACDLAQHFADTVARDYNYKRYISLGDSCFSGYNWRDAKENYRKASNLKPMEQYPKDKMRKCDEWLAKTCDMGMKRYHAAINAGDSLFMAGNYRAAKSRYQEAVALKGTEQYPKDQIAKCNEFLKED